MLAEGGIRVLRQKAGLKLSKLAELAEISNETLKQLERGLLSLEEQHAAKLAPLLGVTPKQLKDAYSNFVDFATPGEGYTTSSHGTYEITMPQIPLSEEDDRLRVLDLFCGAGGLSYGFESTERFVTVGGIDLLPDRIATFSANHPHAVGIAADIRTVTHHDIAHRVGRVDVIVGGPPCQGFSSIRPFRTLTEGDPRNSLVEHYVLMIANIQPRWFVFENVVGIVTHEGGEKLSAILEGLRAAGYTVDWRIVNAALFGVPQNRERVVIVGNREGITFTWPRPTHHIEHRSMAGKREEIIRVEPIFDAPLPPAVTLMEAIGDLPEVDAGKFVSEYKNDVTLTEYQTSMRSSSSSLTWHHATNHSEKMLNIIRHAGNSINDLPKGMVTSGFSSCYSRLAPDKPSTTITVNFVHPASNRCIHPYQHRALTPREGARVQSFPDDYVFKGTSAKVVKQIGNAVPPLLGKKIAQAIARSVAN